MAELGIEVLGMDVDESEIAMLQSGDVPFFEPGLPELLRKNLETGRLRFTTSYEDTVEFAWNPEFLWEHFATAELVKVAANGFLAARRCPTTRRSAGGSCTQASASAGAACPRTRAFMARAGDLDLMVSDTPLRSQEGQDRR